MSGSATQSAMVSSGLKLEAGSWNTNPICSRTGRKVRSLKPTISCPSTCKDPPVTLVRPAIARPMVVLPDPLSPTRPSTSRGAIVKLTSSTARNALRPNLPANSMTRLSATTTGAASAIGGRTRLHVDARHRREELLRVRMLGVREQLDRGRLLDQLALVHDRHAVGEVGDDAHVVGDEDDRGAELVTAAAQQVEDLRLHGHVEGRCRFVRDDQLGIEHERHRDDDALLLAARRTGAGRS